MNLSPPTQGDETASPSPPLTMIPAQQIENMSRLRQEKFAYLLHERLERELNARLDYGVYWQVRDILNHCVAHKIHKEDIIYKFIQYYFLKNVFIYDLAQLPEDLSSREREIFLEKLLDDAMQTGKA